MHCLAWIFWNDMEGWVYHNLLSRLGIQSLNIDFVLGQLRYLCIYLSKFSTIFIIKLLDSTLTTKKQQKTFMYPKKLKTLQKVCKILTQYKSLPQCWQNLKTCVKVMDVQTRICNGSHQSKLNILFSRRFG